MENKYLSDDDFENDDNNEYINVNLDQYGMPIEELDEEAEEAEIEIRRIINEKLLSKNYSIDNIFYNSNLKKEKKIIEKKSKNISLNELNVIIDKKIEESQPKKFISKRSLDKKNTYPNNKPNISLKIRTFNPRLEPYLFSNEYKLKNNIHVIDINNFPLI